MAFLELPAGSPEADILPYVGLLLGAVDDWLTQPFNWSEADYDDMVQQMELLKAWLSEVDNNMVKREIGEVVFFGHDNAAPPWLACNGGELSRVEYNDLFNAIGTVWGVGDGSTTFNLPDFRDRSLIGASHPDTLLAFSEVGGSFEHTILTSQLPSHAHQVRNRNQVGANFHTGTAGGNPSIADVVGTTNSATPNTTTSTGGGAPIPLLHPVVGVTWFIWSGVEA